MCTPFRLHLNAPLRSALNGTSVSKGAAANDLVFFKYNTSRPPLMWAYIGGGQFIHALPIHTVKIGDLTRPLRQRLRGNQPHL
ncbi:MAG: hypothetical protein ACLT5P_10995 [Flavonifractor plautii]